VILNKKPRPYLLFLSMADYDGGKKDDTLSILTLGDGDFTYSLDLANYFASYIHHDDVKSSRRNPLRSTEISITASGFDNREALRNKYKDIDSILRKLRSLSTSMERQSFGEYHNGSDNYADDRYSERATKKGKTEKGDFDSKSDHFKATLFVSIRHGVNAIALPSFQNEDLCNTAFDAARYDHVIFNHPHLGTEDAKLHSMFLSHFFHSCENHWLKTPRGVLHLTLAIGQCERWHAIPLAKDHGLNLLRRTPFQPPPSVRDTCRVYYVLRRHQSGKSFSKRTEGSETLIFGREDNISSDVADGTTFELPWNDNSSVPMLDQDRTSKGRKSSSFPAPSANLAELKCQYCDKTFKQERSRKNHLKSVHLDANGNLLPSTGTETYFCEFCQSRSFPSKSALEYHVSARHTFHTNIQPDWCTPAVHHAPKASGSNENSIDEVNCGNQVPKVQTLEECEICKVLYSESFGPKEHMKQFQPVSKKRDSDGQFPLQCQRCQKEFWDNRARLQHENYCITRDQRETS